MSKRILRRALSSLLGLAIMVSLFPSSVFASETKPPEDPLSSQVLISDWKIAPSTENSLGITPVDTLEADTATWTPAAVPGTVLESLKAAGLTEAKSQDFESGWWYAAKFAIPGEDVISALEFRGITGDATLFINGTQVPSSQVIATDDGYYLVMLDGLAAAGEIADIRLLVSHPESATTTDGSIGLTGAVYLDTTVAPQASAMALATPAEVPSFSEKLTQWKIAPSAAGTHLGMPAMQDWDAVYADTSNWVNAAVPGTVLGNLLDAGAYDDLFAPNNEGKKDVFFSDNMSKLPMSDFTSPWWYSTSFTLPSVVDGTHVNLNFQGISFTGEIYVNGHKLTNKNITVTAQDTQDDKSVLGTGTGFVDPSSTLPKSSSLAIYPNTSPFSDYSDKFLGTFRYYDVDVTDYINKDGSPNDLRVKVSQPLYKNETNDNAASGDLTTFWVDWDPQPADNNMGLTGNVIVSLSGAVRLSNPAAAAKVSNDLTSADLTFYVDLNNMTDEPVRGTLTGVILAPDGSVADTLKRDVLVNSGAYCQETSLTYHMENPQLWWPNQYGDQPLYSIKYTFAVGGALSGTLDHRFGVREIGAEINTAIKANGNNSYMFQLYVNHQPVLLEGGGYSPTDLYLRHSERSNKAVVDYVKYMGMNMIRDEGKFFDNDFLDLLDENGILLMVGWCCCDRHQNTPAWTKAERFVSYEGLYSQLRNLRSHASAGVWLNGSDAAPTPMVEYKYLAIEGKLHWLQMGAVVSNASAPKSTYTNVFSGLHMDTTYDSQTPNFFYSDDKGNFGFTSEGGGGAGIPVAESIRKVIPKANEWPYNTGENANIWNYHASRQTFNQFNQIASFIDNTYGPSTTLDQFAARAQLFDYDSQRAQYEAQSMFRFVNTSGLVNWMLNSAWPIFYWNQFDYYLNPHGSTYGTRKANEPVHIMYDTYNKQVCVINNTRNSYAGLTATLSIYDINGNLISSGLSKQFNLDPIGASAPVDKNATTARTPAKVGFDTDSSGNLIDVTYNINGKIEQSYGIENVWNYNDIMGSLTKPTSDVYFLRLELKDASGKVVSYNSYAEPMRSDVAGANHQWSRSAVYQTADLTQLNALPAVTLKVSQTGSVNMDGKVVQTLSIQNPTANVAYGVELKAYTDGTKKDLVAPVLYSDNLFTLFPGETRVITVSHNASDLKGNAVIGVDCYNNLVTANARAATNIYQGIDLTAQGSNNLARDKAVTVTGFTGGTPANATTVSAAAKTAAQNGKTFVDSNIYAQYDATGNGSFTVNLGSVQTFDRIMLRWSRSANTINNRPDHIKLEISSDNATYTTLLEDYDNTNAASVMTNIVLSAAATGQYLRVTPTGRRTAAPAVGLVSGQYPFTSQPIGGGIAAVSAPTVFTCSAVEVYSFRRSAYLDIAGDGKVTISGQNYTPTMNANQRVALAGTDGSLSLTIASTDPTAAVKVLRDGTDVTASVVDGVLSLTGVTKDTTISVRFGAYQVTFDSNGGSSMGDPVAVEAGAKLAKPAAPTRADYTLVGWYQDSGLTIPWNFDTDTVKSSMTLYAKWAVRSEFSQQLTAWKIAPTAAGTTSLLPALTNDAAVAAPGFDTRNWVSAKVPGTVLGNLLDAGIYDNLFTANNEGQKDVFFANNISKIPYLDFEKPWWYSTNFTLPSDQAGKKVNVNFQGISYVGEIYVNGHKLANKNVTVTDINDLKDDQEVLKKGTGYAEPTFGTKAAAASTLAALGYCKDDNVTPEASRVDSTDNYNAYKDKFIGSFRSYDVDITDYVTAGESVNIKVKVTRPIYGNDLTSFWVDWNPEPPDNNMGLTGAVVVSTSDAVRLSNPAVASKVSTDLASADLTFYVDASNMTGAPVTGTLTGVIKAPDGSVVDTITKDNVTVAAGAYCQEIAVKYTMTNPELWWPYLSGSQPLYTVDYTFAVDGSASGTLHHRFGVREISAEINISAKADSEDLDERGDEQMLQVYVNHKPVMLKGGGYCPTDLFLRHDQDKNEAVVDYIKYMGMNMIRDEGKFFDNDLLDLLDENGILLMTGWCCCDQFQQTQNWRMAERFVGYESQYAQLRNARSHPAMALWFNGSDNPPSAMVEYAYFRIEAKLRWMDMGAISASGSSAYGGEDKLSGLSGLAGGMHMDAAYDTQTPTFYYTDPHGTFGFVSEGGGGAAIPVLETIKKIIPEGNQWPYNTAENYNVWNYHTCRGGFNTLNHLTSFLDNTYGGSNSLEEYLARAQIFDYDSQRAQYEAQALFRYTSTSGIVNWMLNNAWPIIYWNQFDFYMNPHGSTFGTRKANEPAHIMYNVYDKEVYVINNTFESTDGMTASIQVYDINGKAISEKLIKTLNIAPDGASAPVAEGSAGRESIGTQWVGLDYDETTGEYSKRYYNINGQIKESTGVNQLWNYDDIQKSLTGTPSDVCFIRLELKDSTDKVVSYNSYAEPLRGDVAGANHNWNRSKIYQNADLTQLNQLPNVTLTSAQTGSVTADGKVTQTLSITNFTDKVAYAVELKAYTNAQKTDLVAPVLYSDNLFTLFPGEQRTITVTHNAKDLGGDAVITVNCYNNVIQGEKPTTITNIYGGLTQNASGTYNMAKGAAVTLVSGSGGTPANATSVAAQAETNAAGGKTFIESDLNTGFTTTGTTSFVVDLGLSKGFDRIILRWSTSTGAINVRPDTVKVEVSSDNATWSNLVTYDNTKAASVMTDIVLPAQTEGRYLRITPNGRMGAVSAYGMVDDINKAAGVTGNKTNRSGIAAVNAPTQFTCSAIEVYAFRTDFTVTFESNGGSAVTSMGANNGSKLVKPTDPARSGYTFGGWYQDSALTAKWDFASDTVTGNVTLYAKWNAQGGSGGNPAPATGDKTTTVTLPDGTVAKTVTKTDGTVITTATRKDGIVIVTTATPAGKISAEVTLPKGMTSAVATIPAEEMGPGTVAYLVNPDGSKTLVTKSYAGEDGIVVPVAGSVKLEIVDNGKSFRDVASSAWYAPAVTFASGHELFQGTSATLFAPEASMTRAMLMTVLARLEGKDTSKGETWYSVGVEWAKSVGISDGTNLEGNITREQLAAMLYRYAKAEKTTGTLNAFPDAGQVSPWAVDAMAWAVEQGIIQGSGGRLNPAGNASRAEVATMLMRFVMNLNP